MGFMTPLNYMQDYSFFKTVTWISFEVAILKETQDTKYRFALQK